MAANERKFLRCAIYTRKSSEHGLEQDFNSLDGLVRFTRLPGSWAQAAA